MVGRDELLYAEALRRLSEQESALSGFRSSAGTIVGTTTIGTGFLSSVALEGNGELGRSGWFAVVLLVVSIAAAAAVLWPRRFDSALDVIKLEEDGWEQLDADTLRSTLAPLYETYAKKNDTRLRGVELCLCAAIVCGGASIILWVLLAATR